MGAPSEISAPPSHRSAPGGPTESGRAAEPTGEPATEGAALWSARATIRKLERGARAYWPLTARGAGLLALSGMALWLYGYRQLDLVVFVLAVAGLALVASALAATVISVFVVRRHLRSESSREARSPRPGRFLEAGEPFATGFEFTPPRFALARVSWRWDEPPGVACELRDHGGVQSEVIKPTRRGHWNATRRIFSVGDAFGLARISWDETVPVLLRVLPDVGRLRDAMVLEALAPSEGVAHPRGSLDGDRMEIRRYVPGDSARDILWKVYARTGQLNVRRPERSVARHRRSVFYLVSADRDEPAAAAARVALESEAFGRGWRFGADGAPEPTHELAPALAAIARSGSLASASAGDGAGLDAYLDHVAREGETHCIVFVPGVRGPWTQRVLAAAARRRVELSFVVCVERLVCELPGGAPPTWQRWLVDLPQETGTHEFVVDALARELAGAAVAVWVAEREVGRSERHTVRRGAGVPPGPGSRAGLQARSAASNALGIAS